MVLNWYTVNSPADGQFKLYPYEGTWLELNQRRKAIGMDSMESYFARLKMNVPLPCVSE
jgi:hypothetical protein